MSLPTVINQKECPITQPNAKLCPDGLSSLANQQAKLDKEKDVPLDHGIGSAWMEYGEPENQFPQKPIARSVAQRNVLAYLKMNPNIAVNNAHLAKTLSLPSSTLRKIIRKFKLLGIIRTREYRDMEGNQGLHIVFLGQSTGISAQNTQIDQATWSSSKIDRSNLSISSSAQRLKQLSDKDIAHHWPHLARAGFCSHQISQIIVELIKIGKTADHVQTGLDHLEWELEHNRLVDSKNKQVSSPCDWAFRCLSRHGYYRRPVGYISPIEQAELDKQAEAEAQNKAIIDAQVAIKDAAFQEWLAALDRLSQDERMTIERVARVTPSASWDNRRSLLRAYWQAKIVSQVTNTAGSEACSG